MRPQNRRSKKKFCGCMGAYCGYHVNKLFVAQEKRGFSMIASLICGEGEPPRSTRSDTQSWKGSLELTEGQPLNNDSLQK